MKRNKNNERQRQRKANWIRETKATQMAESTPDAKAKARFNRPPYQARSLIRAQGEQMQRYEVDGYMDKQGHDVKGEMPSGKEYT